MPPSGMLTLTITRLVITREPSSNVAITTFGELAIVTVVVACVYPVPLEIKLILLIVAFAGSFESVDDIFAVADAPFPPFVLDIVITGAPG